MLPLIAGTLSEVVGVESIGGEVINDSLLLPKLSPRASSVTLGRGEWPLEGGPAANMAGSNVNGAGPVDVCVT